MHRRVSLFGGPDAVLSQRYPFVLPPLGYAPNGAEPAVDAATMRTHHGVEHARHVAALNAVLAAHPALHEYSLGQLVMGLRRWPAEVRAGIREHGSAHANHALYWNLLAPGPASASAPSGRLAEMIARDHGALPPLLVAMKSAALEQTGNGWIWLVKTATNRLAIRALPNDDSPLLEAELPIVGIDLCEHAYVRKYQARKDAYVDAVRARINWDVAGAQVS